MEQKKKLEELLYELAEQMLGSIPGEEQGNKRGDKKRKGTHPTLDEFLDEAITYRIDRILAPVHQKEAEGKEVGIDLIDKAPPEVKRKMEKWVDSCIKWSWRDCGVVYREAFRDGMRLAKKMFL